MKIDEFKHWLDGYLTGTGVDTKVKNEVMAKLAQVQANQLFNPFGVQARPGMLPPAPGQINGGTVLFNDLVARKP